MSLAVVAACAAGAGLAGLGLPTLIGRLPEPEPDPEPDAENTTENTEEELRAETAPQGRPRRPVPDFSLWGLHAQERDKEPYADIAAVPHLVWGCVLACAVVGGVVGWQVGADAALAVVLPVVPVGVAIAVIDWRTRLIPTRLVLPATVYAMLAGVVVWLVTGNPTDLVRGLVGLAVFRSVVWLMWYIRSAGMGFGDVRLAALLGFVLAYLGTSEVFVGAWLGFFVFGVPGTLISLVRWDYRLMRIPFPFGPFMLVGALLGIVLGQPVIDALYD